MAAKTFGVVAGSSIEATDEVMLNTVLITAAAADATAVITDASGVAVSVAAKAGTSFVFRGPTSKIARVPLIAPVTITTTGTGVFVRVDY